MSAARPRIDSIKSTGSSQWGDPSRRPPSPTLSATTTGSRVDFSHPPHLLITRADLRTSIGALTELMTQAKQYRQCLLNLSKATSAFASALETCSRVKGCDSANAGILGASGLEYLIGNQDQLMADKFFREFEAPLLSLLDHYRASVADRQAAYEKACQEKSHLIRKTEHENMTHGRRRNRDLQAFRTALSTLQSLVDDLDRLKSSYHHEVMDAEDELWNSVLDRIALVEREKMDIHDKISAKAEDPSLQPLLSCKPDPFGDGEAVLEEGTIFSVLSPLNLMSTPKSPHPSLSRTPDRVLTPTPQERIGVPPTETTPKAGQQSEAADRTETLRTKPNDTATANGTKRRSFFGRLFQPSTENLASSGSKSGPPRTPTRHTRQASQQSLASNATTYGSVLERNGTDGLDDTERKAREQQALMGRDLPGSSILPDIGKGNASHHGHRSIHAPIPNPRRASGGMPARETTKDRRELNVIEDEGVNGDDKSGNAGGDRVNKGDDDARTIPDSEGAIEPVEPAVQDEAEPTEAATILTEAPTTTNESPEAVETTAPTDIVPEEQVAPPPGDDEPIEEEHRKIPTAPPSPSLEHELEVMGGDKSRRVDAVGADILTLV